MYEELAPDEFLLDEPEEAEEETAEVESEEEEVEVPAEEEEGL